MVSVSWRLDIAVLTCFCSGDPLLGLCNGNDNDEEESETCPAPEQS